MFMHPIGGGAYLPMINALAHAGHHVIYCNSRFRGTDSALLMEKVVEDLGECIKDAKNRLGYDKVVLAGWSGGGSLSAFYQQQAQKPTVTASPSGDGPDLTKLGLIPADGIMMLAAHISRHGTLTEWLDASILDESDPSKRDPELDLYNPDNPNQPPYTAEFLERYRAAQIARNRRITKWVKEKLAELKAAGRADDEFAFVVHGTMADPRWLDPTVDPNDRAPRTTYLGDPQVVNNGPVGLARFCTLRSWLSQWSYDDANGDAVKCGPDIAVPALVIGNRADDACTPSHTHRLFEAIGHPDKEMYEIAGANHYYSGPNSAEPCAKRSASARTGCTGTGSRNDEMHRPAGRHPGHRGRHADLRPVRGPTARRHGRRGHQDRAAGAPDPLRTWGQAELDGHHFFWTVHARNKKAVTLNLREAAGRELFLDLVERSDIIVENFRPGTLEKWGLGYDELRARNKGIILVRVSGYGQTGPGGAQGRIRLGRRGGQRAAAHERVPRRTAAPAGTVARRQPGGHVRRPGRDGRAVPAHRHRRGAGGRRRVDGILSGRAGIDHSRLRRRRCGARPVGHPPRGHRPVEHLPDRRRQLGGDRRQPGHRVPAAVRGDGPARAGHRRPVRQSRCARPQSGRAGQDHRRLGGRAQPDDIISTLSEAGVISGPINTVAEVVKDPQLRARGMLADHFDERIGRNVLGPAWCRCCRRRPGTMRNAGSARPGQHNDEVYQRAARQDRRPSWST